MQLHCAHTPSQHAHSAVHCVHALFSVLWTENCALCCVQCTLLCTAVNSGVQKCAAQRYALHAAVMQCAVHTDACRCCEQHAVSCVHAVCCAHCTVRTAVHCAHSAAHCTQAAHIMAQRVQCNAAVFCSCTLLCNVQCIMLYYECTALCVALNSAHCAALSTMHSSAHTSAKCTV